MALSLTPEVYAYGMVFATNGELLWEGTKEKALEIAERLRALGEKRWEDAHAHPMLLDPDGELSTTRFVVRCDSASVLMNFSAKDLKVNAYFGPSWMGFLDLCRGEDRK